MSATQYTPLSLHQTDESQWDVPRLYKDKIYRSTERPSTAAPLGRRREGSLPGPPHVPFLVLRAKSSTAIPTSQSLQLHPSPTSSMDMSVSRFSLDAQSLSGSLPSQSERLGGLGQGLRAKGSRLLRRRNSKFKSQTLEWLEHSEDRPERASVLDMWTKRSPRHSRIKSAGNSFVDKREISAPFNFQHLTHTYAQQFPEIETVDHHELANEFSAIRASQVPRRELQGIKAERLPSNVSQSEPASPTRPALYAPRSTSSIRHSQASDYVWQAQSSSKPRTVPNFVSSPPPQSFSRATMTAAPDFFTIHHEDPAEHTLRSFPAYNSFASTDVTAPYSSHEPLSDNSDKFQDFDFSAIPHAVTTPDDSAFPLSPSRVRASGAELADVPEEDEKTTISYSRPSTPGSGLRHAKSFPSRRPTSFRWSQSPRNASASESDSNAHKSADLSQSEVLLPLVGESFNDIPVRSRLSRPISLKPQFLDACWEDDIDYCYEHAAEADCDFDWDKVTARKEDAQDNSKTRESSIKSQTHSISEGYENVCSPTSSTGQMIVSSSLPRLRTSLSVPPLSSGNSAESPSTAGLATPATPLYPLQSPQPYGLSKRNLLDSTEVLNLTPPLSGDMDNCLGPLSEEVYDNMFLEKHYPEDQLPLHSLRFDPPASQDDSPRSSRSRISKCNSQESFMLSRSSSLRYPQSCDSFASVPELVHSKRSRDKCDVSAEQLAELAMTIKATEGLLDIGVPRLQRSNQSLAKDVARSSMLQKAPSFNSVDEEDLEESEVVVLPSLAQHERSQSATVAQPLSTLAQQRKRSASSATALTKASRGPYSLFPPLAVRSPF